MPYIGNNLATQFQAFATQTITGDGSTSYTLDRAVANGKELLVYINNVKQEEGSDKSYTASGTTITFSEAVASGDSCYLVYMGSAQQTVTAPAGSIVSGQIANASLELPNSLDMNGKELILDADGDTSITADTDDQVDIKVGGSDVVHVDSSGNVGISAIPSGEAAAAHVVRLGDQVCIAEYDDGSNPEQFNLFHNSDSSETYIETGTASVIQQRDGEIIFKNAASGSAGAAISFAERMSIGTSEVVINEDGADLDFRVEADASENCFKVDAAADTGQGVVLFGQSQANSSANGAYFSLGTNNAHLLLANEQTSNALALLYFNRQGSDGTYVEFRQASSAEGSIYVSGSTVTYAGFSGQHESSGIATDTPVGTVVSTIDELDVYSEKQNSEKAGEEEDHPKAGQPRADHAKVEVSNTVGDKAVYGVVSSFNTQGKVNVASVGIGSVRVTGACAKGDLLESNGDGTAKVQSDDIVRSKTIGKVTIGNSDTGVKLVSCVLYCG